MSRIFSFVIAGAILGVSVALAAFLVSLAPEPIRTELPPQVPFAQTGLVAAGTGPIPHLRLRDREAKRRGRHRTTGGREKSTGWSRDSRAGDG